MFEIEYEFGEEDLIHFNEIQFMRNDEIQHNIKKNRWVVPGVMALIGSFYYFYYGDMKSSVYIVFIANPNPPQNDLSHRGGGGEGCLPHSLLNKRERGEAIITNGQNNP